MTDQKQNPSRQLRILARTARWLLGMVLAFWLLLFVAWGALHGLIVPRISEWRVQVECLATQALGATVRIDAIQAQSTGLLPSVFLKGVSVENQQGQQVLFLQDVIATISLRSLILGGVAQLVVDAPVLDVRRLVDGRWQIAGLELAPNDGAESKGLEWLLAQPELVIRHGQLSFTDELRATPAVQLHDINFLIRNGLRSHEIRLDAVPEGRAGERIQIAGDFTQPVFAAREDLWKTWSGQWYGTFHLQQTPLLPWKDFFNVQELEGSGQARAWLKVQEGKGVALTVDMALAHADIRWADVQLAPLTLKDVYGRIEIRKEANAWVVQGHNFRLLYGNGVSWAASNWQVHAVEVASEWQSAQVTWDRVDIAALSQVVQAMPVAPDVRAALKKWSPQGVLTALKAQWSQDGTYQASADVVDLLILPQVIPDEVGIPGVQGLNGAVVLNERGGQAQLNMQEGALHFPGVFEEPAIPLTSLQAQIKWTVDKGQIRVEAAAVQFANSDAQGSLEGYWKTGELGKARLPGYLHIKGLLDRADGARVYRYLPLEVSKQARNYVRDSVKQGQGRQVEFEVQGYVEDMPFEQPETGRFFIKAPIQNVVYAFVPPALKDPSSMAWPALTQLSGTLIFEGIGMTVQQAQTGFVGHPHLRMRAIDAHISDLENPRLQLSAKGVVDLNALLAYTQQSPLAELTSHALDDAQAQGTAQVEFDLDLPIEHLEKSKVQGLIGFQKNGLRMHPYAPWLSEVQGGVQFNEQGFALKNVSALALGGVVQASGGMPSLAQGVDIQAQGMATAQGLQAYVPSSVSQLAAHVQGTMHYTVNVHAKEDVQKVTVRSDMQGMALNFPAPFDKAAQAHWPLQMTQSWNGATQEMSVQVQDRLHIAYQISEKAGHADNVRGVIAVGHSDAFQLPPAGVKAVVNVDVLDLDTWVPLVALNAADEPNDGSMASSAYVPHDIQLRVQQLRVKQRVVEQVRAHFTESSGTWRGRLDAQQIAGTLAYRAPAALGDAGKLFARLDHLTIPQTEVQRLNAPVSDDDPIQLTALPALDVEVAKLVVMGKTLGKLQLQARNTQGPFGRDWTLDQFNVTSDEARWMANGAWISAPGSAAGKTQLDFVLEMDSTGALLERIGQPGVIKNGRGYLGGSIGWDGSPFAPDWRSMSGGVHLVVEQGQFLKVEPGFGRLLSVLSLQSLSRRVSLDFRDVFHQGFAFDFIRGDIGLLQGVAKTSNLQMAGLNAAVLMEGSTSLVDETQNLRVVVVPEINAMTASLAASVINPVIGLGSFFAQMLLRGPLMEAATRVFSIKGTWIQPEVEQEDFQKVVKDALKLEGATP